MKLFMLIFLLTSPAFADVLVVGQETSGAAHRGTTSGTPLTWSFVNNDGNFLCLGQVVVVTLGQGPVTVSTPTYGGRPFVLAGQFWYLLNGANYEDVLSVFCMENPPTGSNTVSINGTGGSGYATIGGAIAFKNVLKLGIKVTATVDGTTHGTTAAIAKPSGNMILGVGSWGSGEGGTADAGFTRTFVANGSSITGGDDLIGIYQVSRGAALIPGFTWLNTDIYAMIALELIGGAIPSLVPTGRFQ